MTDPMVTEPVAKRADQLVVGDRILPHRLPSTYALGPGEVVYVKPHVYRGNSSVFVAYMHKDGYYDSTSYLPDGTVEVLPADPTGQLYTRADDGETTQPIAGRIPPHFESGRVVEVAGGLVAVDPPEGFVPASAPVRGVSPDGVPLCSHGDDAEACQLLHPPDRRAVALTRCGCGPEHGPQCTQGL